MSGGPEVERVAERYRALDAALGGVVVGQDEAVRLVFLALLCGGHGIVEGVPGVAKTLLVRTLAHALDLGFARIQFTPDLMPADVTGTPVFHPQEGEFRFRPGPIFTDLLLADEINRASAKTQAALLEAMQERSVTVDGVAHPLSRHFSVFATQNPVEHEGTYPLPEAQLDRFLFKIVVDYPDAEAERALLALHHREDRPPHAVEPVLSADELDAVRGIAAGVIVQDEILGYVAELVRATRSDVRFALGASPRAGLMLLRAAKANAALERRDFVIPEDVQRVWAPTLRHRIQLDPAVEVEGLRPDQALAQSLESVTVPR